MNANKINNINNETKAKIIEAGRDVFFRIGFKKATIKEISQLAGVAYGTTYIYFPNKTEIFLYIINDALKEIYMMARNSFFPTTTKEAYDLILIQVKQFLGLSINKREWLLIIKDGIESDEALKKKWSEVQQYFISTITQDITYSKNKNLVRADVIPEIAAVSWFAISECFLWALLNQPEDYCLESVANQITKNYICSIYSAVTVNDIQSI